ncbi:MAG: calcium-binding protein, partial [Alphaproteobacteria bacterium]
IEDDRFYATGLFVGTVDFDPGPDAVIRDSDVSQQKHFLVEFDLPVSAGSGNDGGGSTPPDRVPPPAPRIAAFDTDTGNPNDHFTTDRTLVIRGTAEAGATVLLFRTDPLKGTVPVGTAVADAGGNWLVDDTRTTLPPGTFDYWAQAVDPAGNTSPFSEQFRIVVEDVSGSAGFGGPGSIIYGHGFGSDWVEGGSAADSIRGGAGDDTVFGRDGDDRLFGDSGADNLNGNTGNDELHGDDGNDVIFGGQGFDRLYGDFGDDLLYGNRGSDILEGAAGNDTLFGGRGRDQLSGGAGDDELHGDRGDDTMAGGVGADRFHFAAEGGSDLIEDFDPAADHILVDLDAAGMINGVPIASPAALLARIVDTAEGAFLDLGGGQGVLLAGIGKAQLSAEDFLLV